MFCVLGRARLCHIDMEGFSKAIQQPEYVHVLLNHFPITGLLVALVFLVVGIWGNNRVLLTVSLAAVSVLALSAWPVAHYGEQAYDRVLSMSDEAGGEYLKHHEELADRWVFLFYVTAGAAALALIVAWKKPGYLRLATGIVALLAIASLVAGAAIADCGGKIRHREFRYGPPPTPHHNSDDGTG
jgi:hypothetical protein